MSKIKANSNNTTLILERLLKVIELGSSMEARLLNNVIREHMINRNMISLYIFIE